MTTHRFVQMWLYNQCWFEGLFAVSYSGCSNDAGVCGWEGGGVTQWPTCHVGTVFSAQVPPPKHLFQTSKCLAQPMTSPAMSLKGKLFRPAEKEIELAQRAAACAEDASAESTVEPVELFPALPAGWTACCSETGEAYYYHPVPWHWFEDTYFK